MQERDPKTKRSTNWRKIASLIVALIPILVLIILTSSYYSDEYYIANGTLDNPLHLVAIVLVIFSLTAAVKNNKMSGNILLATGIALGLYYVTHTIFSIAGNKRMILEALGATLLLIFGPLIISGLLLRSSARKESEESVS